MLAGLSPCLRCGVRRGVGGYTIPLYISSQPAGNWGKGEESDKTTNSVLKALHHTGAVSMCVLGAGYSARPPLGRHYLGGGPAAD